MIHKDLIFLNENAADRKTLFRDVAKKIRAAGYARDTYEAALNKREDEFPTGVVFPEISVMLPHADPENVNEPFMAIVKNAQPVRVLQMGYNEPEDATAMFFLGITDAKASRENSMPVNRPMEQWGERWAKIQCQVVGKESRSA